MRTQWTPTINSISFGLRLCVFERERMSFWFCISVCVTFTMAMLRKSYKHSFPNCVRTNKLYAIVILPNCIIRECRQGVQCNENAMQALVYKSKLVHSSSCGVLWLHHDINQLWTTRNNFPYFRIKYLHTHTYYIHIHN